MRSASRGASRGTWNEWWWMLDTYTAFVPAEVRYLGHGFAVGAGGRVRADVPWQQPSRSTRRRHAGAVRRVPRRGARKSGSVGIRERTTVPLSNRRQAPLVVNGVATSGALLPSQSSLELYGELHVCEVLLLGAGFLLNLDEPFGVFGNGQGIWTPTSASTPTPDSELEPELRLRTRTRTPNPNPSPHSVVRNATRPARGCVYRRRRMTLRLKRSRARRDSSLLLLALLALKCAVQGRAGPGARHVAASTCSVARTRCRRRDARRRRPPMQLHPRNLRRSKHRLQLRPRTGSRRTRSQHRRLDVYRERCPGRNRSAPPGAAAPPAACD